MELSLNIPAYEESSNLSFLLPQLIKVLDKLDSKYEINVIDTLNKIDDTDKVCSSFDNVNHYRRILSNSFGSAYKRAIDISKGDFTIFMDADGSHDPNFIPNFIKFKNKYDVIIASRYVKGGATENSFFLTLMSKLLNIVYSKSLGLNCKDVSNSFKLYRTKDLKSIDLLSDNFDIIEEILYKLKLRKKRFRILELPYKFKNRVHGETKRDLLKFILTFIATLYRLKFLR